MAKSLWRAENTSEVPVAIVDEKTKVLIGAIFREDLFEKTKSTNCNAPTTNREEEDAKAEVGENNNKRAIPDDEDDVFIKVHKK